jgi:hypothetical protein
MARGKKVKEEEKHLDIKIEYHPIASKEADEFKLEKEQLQRLEEQKVGQTDIVNSLHSSIDRVKVRIDEAITKEEKSALLDRIKLLMFQVNEQEKKEQKIIDEIKQIKGKLFPLMKSGSDNKRLVNGYKVESRGYTEDEEKELYDLIDSVVKK